jgi:RHS repeat-associated protein
VERRGKFGDPSGIETAGAVPVQWGQLFARDALGSETQNTDYAGNGGQAILFFPSGQKMSVSSTLYPNTLYQDFASLQLYDTSTDGYVPPFRYYVSNQGRWLTPDPLAGNILNPQSLNRYAYVMNNPTTFTDPLGLLVPIGENPFSPGCTVDGFAMPCGFIGQNSVLPCPNNACTGASKNNLPVQYHATEVGGYYSCVLTGTWGSQNEAGEAAVNCINGASIATNTEYGGNIYEMANGNYSFTQPVGGTADSVEIPDTIPDATTFAGDYHTHGAYDPNYYNEIFSPQDIFGITQNGQPGYLGTPASRIEVFSPNQASQLPLGCVLVGSPVPANQSGPGGTGVPQCH